VVGREVLRSLLRPASTTGGLGEAARAASVREIFQRFWPDARPFWRWLWLSPSLLVVPVFWAARVFARRIKIASREVRRRAGSITVVAEESLGNATLIQAYGRECAEVDRFATQSMGIVHAELAATRLGAMFAPLVDLVQMLGVLTILGVGIWELTVHEFISALPDGTTFQHSPAQQRNPYGMEQ